MFLRIFTFIFLLLAKIELALAGPLITADAEPVLTHRQNLCEVGVEAISRGVYAESRKGECILYWPGGKSRKHDHLEYVDFVDGKPLYLARTGDDWFFAAGRKLGGSVEGPIGFFMDPDRKTIFFDFRFGGETKVYRPGSNGWIIDTTCQLGLVQNRWHYVAEREDGQYLVWGSLERGPYDEIIVSGQDGNTLVYRARQKGDWCLFLWDVNDFSYSSLN